VLESGDDGLAFAFVERDGDRGVLRRHGGDGVLVRWNGEPSCRFLVLCKRTRLSVGFVVEFTRRGDGSGVMMVVVLVGGRRLESGSGNVFMVLWRTD